MFKIYCLPGRSLAYLHWLFPKNYVDVVQSRRQRDSLLIHFALSTIFYLIVVFVIFQFMRLPARVATNTAHRDTQSIKSATPEVQSDASQVAQFRWTSSIGMGICDASIENASGDVFRIDAETEACGSVGNLALPYSASIELAEGLVGDGKAYVVIDDTPFAFGRQGADIRPGTGPEGIIFESMMVALLETRSPHFCVEVPEGARRACFSTKSVRDTFDDPRLNRAAPE